MKIERRLARAFAESHPVEAAQALERLPEAERSRLLEDLPHDAALAVLRQMEASAAADALAERTAAGVAAVIAAMPAQNGARLLERFDPVKRREVLASMPADSAGAVQRLLHYPADSSGALMDPGVVAVPEDITVKEALQRLQRGPRNLRYYVYVVDRDDRLVGVLTLRELMLASPAAPLASLMHRDVERLSIRATRNAILAHPGWRNFHALPVVDKTGVLAGVLRYDTLRGLEADSAVEESPALLPLGLALGELYVSAATAVLYGAFDAYRAATRPPPVESPHAR